MEKEVKKNKKKTIIITSVIGLLVILGIIVSILLIMFILPKKYIDTINTEYEQKQYEKVSIYNDKLGSIQNYLKDNNEYNKIQYKVKYSTAITLCKKKEYEKALTNLGEILTKDDEVNNKINDCKYELGRKYIEEEKFEEAIEKLQDIKNKEDLESIIDEAYYKLALKILERKDYKKALEIVNKTKNKENENIINTKKKIHYEYGKYSLSENDYNGGISQLEQAKDYEDANTLVINAYIEQAEKYIKDDNLKEAKQIYDYLPEDASHNGIDVATRKEQLDRFADLIEATGKKTATKSYCETKNIWKYDGRWTNWYIDTPDSSEYITTKITLNSDGTINIKGTANFYAYSNFSSLKEYCKAQIISKTIKIERVDDMPSSFDIDEYTKLRYSNGVFSIIYSKTDDYSTSFYNEYNSRVTY